MTRALLVLQEGPGAGRACPLDPAVKSVFAIGRSSSCDVVLNDHRSSRQHANLQWTGRGWEVVDLESTNGTYVNGMRVHHPYPLRTGDRVTVGDTTLVLRDAPAESAVPAARAGGGAAAGGRLVPAAGRAGDAAAAPAYQGRRAAAAGEAGRQARARTSSFSWGFWTAQGMVTLAVICLAAGSLLPWIEIRGQVRADAAPLLQQGFEIWGALTGTDPAQMASYRIDGTMAHGRLTIALAVVCTAALVVEIFFHRKSLIPGVIYLVTGLMVIATMSFDAINYAQHASRIQETDLLFGYQVGDLTEALGTIVEVEAAPQVGVYLVGAGLALLLAGGVVRVLSGMPRRERGLYAE
ncbi:MAG TPA: FHA domain-containing protein [Anaerolineae bacterium]|nr:FHA domain-containing protein [Anaerolineae bacterium]